MARMIWAPYVPMAERRQVAARLAKKQAGAGRALSPVVIEGRTIAHTFWGKAWCDSVDDFSDYANRLPRGKRYARNGSVIDLQVDRGAIIALVNGSSVYTVRLEVAPMAPERWTQLCRQCSGSVASAVELLQGKLDRAVMSQMSSSRSGLFPATHEVKMSCSCPDSATLCKHVAAVLYGVGARLDEKPELLFTLRGVEVSELVSAAVAGDSLTRGKSSGRRKLDSDALDVVFDIELGAHAAQPAKVPPSRPLQPKAPATVRAASGRAAVKKSTLKRAAATKARPTKAAVKGATSGANRKAKKPLPAKSSTRPAASGTPRQRRSA